MTAPEQELAPPPAALAVAAPPPVSPWVALRNVPMRLSVDIPLPPMSLRALGAMQPGQVLCSAVPTADDLIVTIGGTPVCQARFEFMDGRMAMRMTRLVGTVRAGA